MSRNRSVPVCETARGPAAALRLTAIIGVFCAAMWNVPPVVADGGGVVRGVVINATTGEPSAGQTVEIWKWLESDGVIAGSAVSDKEGLFEVGDLDAGSGSTYRAQTTYAGVSYVSEVFALTGAGSDVSVHLRVFETTGTGEAVSINRFNLVILATEPGNLSVLEMYQFGNEGKATLVAGSRGEGQPTVSIELPAHVADLALQNRVMAGEVELTGSGLACYSPIVPGKGTLTLAFSYRLQYLGEQVEMSRKPPYRTEQVNVLLDGEGVELVAASLASKGTVEADGQSFDRFEGGPISPGGALTLRLDNLPAGVSPAGTASPDDVSSVDSSLARVARPMTLGVGVILLVVGLCFPHWSPRFPPVISRSDERRRLLRELADLDDAHALDVIDAETHRMTRQELRTRLATVWTAGDDRGAS